MTQAEKAVTDDSARLSTVLRLVDAGLNEWKNNSLVDASAVRDQLLDIRQTITRDNTVLGTTDDATPSDDDVDEDDVGIVIHTR